MLTIAGYCTHAGWRDDDIRKLVLHITNGEWEAGDWRRHLDEILDWVRREHEAAIAAMPAAPPSIAAAFGAGGAL